MSGWFTFQPQTLAPIANLPLVATRVVSRVWISSSYVFQKLLWYNIQPTTRTSTKAVHNGPAVN